MRRVFNKTGDHVVALRFFLCLLALLKLIRNIFHILFYANKANEFLQFLGTIKYVNGNRIRHCLAELNGIAC